MTNKSKDLSDRQMKLLFAVVKEYCDNEGECPGSKELKEKYAFDFSPATIRNELVKLREKGYLHQPFTNSSSQPTEKSFKLFINKLIDGLHVSSTQQQKLKTKILELRKDHERMNKEIAKLLSLEGGIGFSISKNSENVTGLSNLLKGPREGKIDDILSFLDNIDDYKQYLLPGEVEDILDVNEETKENKATIRTIIGDENPVIPLGKGYAMVTTEVTLQNGEKSVVGLITPVHLLAKKKNLQLLEALNKVLGTDAE